MVRLLVRVKKRVAFKFEGRKGLVDKTKYESVSYVKSIYFKSKPSETYI